MLLATFPEFQPISLDDRPVVQDLLWKYQSETSELTFTNLFIWRAHYGTMLSRYQDWLFIALDKSPNGMVGLPPVGPPSRQSVTRVLLEWLKGQGQNEPRLERVDSHLVSELAGASDFIIEPVRDDFDYVYKSSDLIELTGRDYHSKRNYINTFRNTYKFAYEELTASNAASCLEMAEEWCRMRRCADDLNLSGEWLAVNEVLKNFKALGVKGGLVRVDGKVEAFTLGEMLNAQTAVIHIEKANPDIRGLYAVINQQFAEHNWREVPFINREQDMGELQLRTAKTSYNPDHMVEKFRIRLKNI